MAAGVIPVRARGDEWTLKANAPVTCAPDASVGDIAATLGLSAADITGPPLWVNTGNEQMVVPVANADVVRRCHPDPARMATHQKSDNVPKFFVWAELGNGEIVARFFLLKHGALMEDHGTGSAAANLGGWFVTQRVALPLQRVIWQGEAIGRPARLMLNVDTGGGIFVGGQVVELGSGVTVL